MSQDVYNPAFFTPSDIKHAREIILMYHEMSADERWESETEWTRDLLIATRTFDKDSVVLDFGCGIGRLSKMLIETFDCQVIGIDIEPKMLEFAKENVNSDKFSTMTYDEFIAKPLKNHFTHAIAVWVLQHSPRSQYDIALINQALRRTGKLFVLDMLWKCIPKLQDADVHAPNFYDDGVKNKDELSRWFNPIIIGQMPESITVKSIVDISWWGFLQKIVK